nr:sporulation protein [uncultured Desulfobacter sp.]
MFKKMFAKMGFGSVKVDAILTTNQFYPGGTVEGRIEIKGGDVEQEISAINLKLKTVPNRKMRTLM